MDSPDSPLKPVSSLCTRPHPSLLNDSLPLLLFFSTEHFFSLLYQVYQYKNILSFMPLKKKPSLTQAMMQFLRTGILCFIAFHFIALHGCCIFYKLKARPSTSKKVTTRFKETVSRVSALEPNLQRLRVGPVLLCSDALKALPGLAVSDFSPPGLSYSSIPVKLLIPLPHSSAFSFLSFLSRKQPFSQLTTPLLLKHFVP